MQRPVIIVHSFAHARAAVGAATELSRAVTLASAPDAGMQSGPAWFSSLIEQALDAVPGARELEMISLLDCGEKPGYVMAALRHGVKQICYTGSAETLAKLREIAEQLDANIITERPQGLDLLGVADARVSCLAWINGGSD
ncbi:hypothetical protein [Pelagibius sp. Alg239-R121]|uniref:hypothetical protein n=1 Tax=Pelagibius sp. Alg239-R121 TaxID=2993448 RepID=UPI0024A6E248|nr:hypothetical protein [Pelagibius sp. Alg239-R121]